jgi:hypothetical protein
VCGTGVELVIPERGGAGIAVHEQEKETVPDVLKNGMTTMIIDNAFLEEVEEIREQVCCRGVRQASPLARCLVLLYRPATNADGTCAAAIPY